MFTIRTCPACQSWTLEHSNSSLDGYVPALAEIEEILREHALECFGIPDEMRLAS